MRCTPPLMLILIFLILPLPLRAGRSTPSSSRTALSNSGQEKVEPFSPEGAHGDIPDGPKYARPIGRRLNLEAGGSEPSTENPFLEDTAIVAFGLLLLCTALASGTLLISLRQRRLLLSLESRTGGLKEALEDFRKSFGSAGLGSPRGQASLGTGGGAMAEQILSITPPVLPSVPDLAPAGGAFTSGDREEYSLQAWRHQGVYDLLNRLHREAPRLAAKFSDPELHERFQREFDAPLEARVVRLKTFSVEGEESLRQRWLGPDLIATLDSLARFYSEAVEEERRGRASGLALELWSWLYEYFGSACRSEGWFAIDPVEPYRTTFDPKVHHAIAGRDTEGAQGLIVALKGIGRRDAKTGTLVQKAEVIVGR